jgi:tetratricopeptide (TPR) repeat protein
MFGVATFLPHDRLAALYDQLGEPKLALRHCRRAIRFNPNDREAYLRMMDLLRAQGCSADRLKSRLLRLAKGEVCPLLILSDLFYDRGMFRQALQMAVRAKRQAPECPTACCDEGICRFFLGQYRRAYRCLREKPCERTGSVPFFRMLCVLLNPDGSRLSTEDFRVKLEKPDYLAVSAFGALLKGESGAPFPEDGGDSRKYTDSVFGLLEVLLRAGLLNEFLKALPLLNRINSGTHLRLGKLYYKYGYAKLAYCELEHSFRTENGIDAEGLSIMSRIRAAAGEGPAHGFGETAREGSLPRHSR